MTKKPTSTHGGARAGAGNPPLGGACAGESRNLVVRLPMQIHNRLEALSTKAGRTKSEVAREILARGLDELPPGP